MMISCENGKKKKKKKKKNFFGQKLTKIKVMPKFLENQVKTHVQERISFVF